MKVLLAPGKRAAAEVAGIDSGGVLGCGGCGLSFCLQFVAATGQIYVD
jgi:hypothetical protein